MARFIELFPPLNPKSVLISPIKMLLAIFLVTAMQFPLSSTAFAVPENPKLANERCLRCHGKENYSRKGADGEKRQLHVAAESFKESVHGGRDCVNCHTDIIKIPHKKGVDRKVGCVRCHMDLWEQAKLADDNGEGSRLGDVVGQIESYMGSVHARPNIDDQSSTNATCYNCHDAHYITPIDNIANPESRLKIPNICGDCHTEVLDTYMTSARSSRQIPAPVPGH